MNFYNYVIQKYLDEDSAQGDLARDMKEDKMNFPKNGVGKFAVWRKRISNYLEGKGACYGCMEAFEKTWEEYEQCERKRLNRRLLEK